VPRVFAAPQNPSDGRHRVQLQPQLGKHPGRDERRDQDHEPDANHGQHGITAQPQRNRVFPLKDALHLAAKLSTGTATGSGGSMLGAAVRRGPAIHVPFKLIELLGNRRYLVSIDNESGEEAHSQEHRQQHVHTASASVSAVSAGISPRAIASSTIEA
jgi:hypothetical protein